MLSHTLTSIRAHTSPWRSCQATERRSPFPLPFRLPRFIFISFFSEDAIKGEGQRKVTEIKQKQYFHLVVNICLLAYILFVHVSSWKYVYIYYYGFEVIYIFTICAAVLSTRAYFLNMPNTDISSFDFAKANTHFPFLVQYVYQQSFMP